MAVYTLNFSDPAKTKTITVPDTTSGTGINNYDTSLDLVGSGYNNYGSAFSQNFLKLLENFAGPNSPMNAIEGQLWYDTSDPYRKVLKVNNGSVTSTRWRPVSGIYQQSNDPTVSFSSVVTEGDLWVDTSGNQLKLRFAGQWTTVGPQTTSGNQKTGSEAVTLESTTGAFYPVILNWANGNVVEIISYNEFIPKAVIEGFYSLKIGTNLTSKVIARYNGIADRAFALQTPAGSVINASDVLKNNAILQTHTGTFVVESGNGLIVKNSSYNKSIKLYNSVSGSFINLSDSTSILKIGASANSYISFNGTYGNIGINTATTSASPALDINGSGRFLGTLTIVSASTLSNSIVTNGKLLIGNSLQVNSNLTVSGTSTFADKIILGSSSTAGISIIVPAINDVFDIGTTSTSFRNIYVSDIGNTNTFTTLYGRVVGTADKLTYPRSFSVAGQFASLSSTFDGSANVTLNVSAQPTLITSQTATTSTTATQTLLIYNTGTGSSLSLEKISKSVFLNDVYPNLLLTGMIMAYSTSTVPSGFLLCDGTSYSQVTYDKLFSVIGNYYGGSVGTFRVPNLTTATVASGTPIFYIIRT